MRINIALIIVLVTCFVPNTEAIAKNQPLTLSNRAPSSRLPKPEPVSPADLAILRKCGLTAGQAIGLAQRNKVKINCEVAIEQVIQAIISGRKTLSFH